MQVSMTTRHCELDPEVRLYAQQRLEKLERYARDLREAHLILSAEKFRYTAEITLRLKHRELASREESNDSRAAIDLAADGVESQLRRLKERRVDRKRNAGREGPMPPASPATDIEQEDDFESRFSGDSATED